MLHYYSYTRSFRRKKKAVTVVKKSEDPIVVFINLK